MAKKEPTKPIALEINAAIVRHAGTIAMDAIRLACREPWEQGH